MIEVISIVLLALALSLAFFAAAIFCDADVAMAQEVARKVGMSLVIGSPLANGAAVVAVFGLKLSASVFFALMALSVFFVSLGAVLIAFGVRKA